MGYLKDNADIIVAAYTYIRNNENLAANALYWAGADLISYGIPVAGAYLQDASVYLDLSSIKMGAVGPYHLNNWYWLDNRWPPEAEVTMSSIIYSMLTATPDEVMYFTGLVDAYRQNVWNKEYNQEFFAAIARGFE